MHLRANFLVSAVAAIAIAGCGSSGSSATTSRQTLAAKSPTVILASVSKALSQITSVHVFGSELSGGRTLGLDLRLAAGQGGTGTITIGRAQVQLVVVGGHVYMKGNAAFWNMLPHASTIGSLFAGRWLKAPESGNFGSFAGLVDTTKLFATTLSNHGPLSNQGLTTINGRRVIALRDAAKGSTLYVSATGAPLPVQIVKPQGRQQVTFDDYNQAVSLSAPPKPLDIAKLAGAGPFG